MNKNTIVYSDVEDLEVGREAYYRPAGSCSAKKSAVVTAVHANGEFETEYSRYAPDNPPPQSS